MQNNISIKNLENSEVEIEGEIPAGEFEKHRSTALQKLGSNVSVPGFRKGHVPEKMLAAHIGESNLLQEMAELALKKSYPEIIKENKIDAIGNPHVTITKLAPGNPLGFRIRTATLPDIKLPDYKEIAGSVVKESGGEKDFSVDDKEVQDTIEQIQKSTTGKDGAPTLEITDESVKKFGDFKNIADFKEKLKAGMVEDKKRRAKEKLRLDMLEGILAKTDAVLPEIIVNAELEKMIAQFKRDIEQMGMKPEDYLKQIKKTEDDLRKEWRADADKRAKTQLVLSKIAREEKITADPERVKKEVEHILSHSPKADKEAVRIYVETMLGNEKVFEFLENQKT